MHDNWLRMLRDDEPPTSSWRPRKSTKSWDQLSAHKITKADLNCLSGTVSTSTSTTWRSCALFFWLSLLRVHSWHVWGNDDTPVKPRLQAQLYQICVHTMKTMSMKTTMTTVFHRDLRIVWSWLPFSIDQFACLQFVLWSWRCRCLLRDRVARPCLGLWRGPVLCGKAT